MSTNGESVGRTFTDWRVIVALLAALAAGAGGGAGIPILQGQPSPAVPAHDPRVDVLEVRVQNLMATQARDRVDVTGRLDRIETKLDRIIEGR